ncbi:MAG: NAD(P)-dependent oxidoreductase [Candidatus Levybacteria bacterium]|nr:NAD(P)-dependent oxidoreductase [Candidatus Levybacteria bacterium]
MKNKKVLITGGAGFLGSNLVNFLLEKKGYEIVIFDKLENHSAKNYGNKVKYYKGNIISKKDVVNVFSKHGPFSVVFHLASAMPNKEVSDGTLWKTNIDGTRNLISQAVENKADSFIFTSSNVAYGIPKNLPAVEKTSLTPLEIYGKSKAQAEKELAKYKNKINIQIIRCPVISGLGRLGLQGILFEFISENKNIYVLGDGLNKYQFADVTDVSNALEKATYISGFNIYNIGCDEILSLRELYEGVIDYAKSTSKIISIPKAPALIILSILDKLNLSPLGIYQYTMIGRSLYLDTSKIKKKLKWKPKKTNLDTFLDNYKWYIENKGKFAEVGSGTFSDNRSLPKMGILKLLKIFS